MHLFGAAVLHSFEFLFYLILPFVRLEMRPFGYAPLAQLVEQLTLNQWVRGSSPRRCTRPAGASAGVSVMSAEGPPVPIPNTEVKLCSGENTLRATVREDSSMPTSDEGKERGISSSWNSRRYEKSPEPQTGV